MLGSLNVLFLAFIIIQFTYLFGGEHNITALGFTYAQYARKGFFELIAVAVLSLVLVLILQRAVAARQDAAASRSFKVLGAVLILQVGIMMVSAFKRLALYESAYGFTSLRLYAHIALVWLAILFALLLFRIVRPARGRVFTLGAVLSSVAVLALINVVPVDVVVARQNIRRLHEAGKIDIVYLAHLSDDATPTVRAALSDPRLKPEFREYLGAKLYDKHQDVRRAEAPWQSWNLGRERALQD